MRSKLSMGFVLAVVVGLLLVTNPVVADAAMARCDVTANPPRRSTPTEPEAYVEGWLTCDPAILPDTFNNTVCLQAKKGNSFVDIHCCRIPNTTVDSTPWLMCGEGGLLLPGKHQYRTRARAFRISTGRGETHYSPAVTFKF
jgi:hypothetical protein